MVALVKGDVVVCPIPFTDLATIKVRPALVVHPLTGKEAILCMITSTYHDDGWSVPLVDNDFQSGNLANPTGSFIRANRLFTIENQIIKARRGRINALKLQEVVEALIELVSA